MSNQNQASAANGQQQGVGIILVLMAIVLWTAFWHIKHDQLAGFMLRWNRGALSFLTHGFGLIVGFVGLAGGILFFRAQSRKSGPIQQVNDTVMNWGFVFAGLALLIPASILAMELSAAGKVFTLIDEMLGHVHVVTFADIMTAANQVGYFYLPVALPFPAYFAYVALIDPVSKMTISYDAQLLLVKLNAIFPYTAPILYRDLLKQNIPGWEPSVSPHEFARRHRLVNKRKLDREVARKVFLKQLGKRFSLKTMAPHERALYAVFAAKIAKDRDAGQDLLAELSRSCLRTKDGAPDYSLSNDLYRKHFKQGMPFAKVHRYTRTLLMSMLVAAKEQGKLTPSFFLWLKPIDRTLWYALNRVGAQVPFTEAAAIWNVWEAEQVAFTGVGVIDWAHFLDMEVIWEYDVGDANEKLRWQVAERQFELVEPYVDNAIDALEEDLIASGIIDDVKELH